MKKQFDIDFSQAQIEVKKVMGRYENHIPIYIERSISSKHECPDIPKHKYIVPSDINIGHYHHLLRKRASIKAEQALFIFTRCGKLVPMTMVLSEVYKQYKDPLTGYLFLIYDFENCFG